MDKSFYNLRSTWRFFSWANKVEQEKMNEKFIAMIKEDFNKFMQILLSNDEINTEYRFMHLIELINKAKINISIEDFINAIITFANKNKALLLYLCATKIKNPPIEKLADAIIETNHIGYILKIATLPNAPIEKLANAIIETKDAHNIYSFAKSIPNAPIDKLTNAIIETKDSEYIYKFANEVEGAPKENLFNAVIELKNFEVICKFIPLLDNITEELVKTIIDTFVKEGQPLENLTLSFIKKKDTKAFSFYIKNATPKITIDYLESALKHFEKNDIIVDDLIDTIISMNDIEYCSLVLRIVPNLSQERTRKLVAIVVNQYPLNDNVKAQSINLFSNLIANNVITKQNIDFIWIMLAKTSLLNEQTLNISESQFDGDDDIKSTIL